MNYKGLIGALVTVGIMLVSGLISCNPSGAPSPTPTETPTPGQLTPVAEFEVIRQAADAYVNSGKPLYITAKELHDDIMAAVGAADYQITSYDPSAYPNGPLIIDVRGSEPEMPDLYLAGHIPGAVHMPWQQIRQYLQILPKDRQIVVVSTNGGTGAAVTSILSVLGYDAVNLMWGMNSWTGDSSPSRYDKARDTITDWGESYVTGSTPEPTETYPFPVVENTESPDKRAIIVAAADAYLTNASKRFDLVSAEPYQALYYEQSPQTADKLFLSTLFTGSATGNPYDLPFLLDIRDDASYNRGHLDGALHVFWQDVFKADNLAKLPLDRPILVYGVNGQDSAAITALLNLLGYDAMNLMWGIAADQFVAERDCMNYPVVTGFQSYKPWQPPPTGP